MASPQAVNDSISNFNETLEHHAEVLKRSERRRAVFRAIYRGKTKTKSVSEIVEATALDHKAVLTAGLALANSHLVEQTKVQRGGRTETAYAKTVFCTQHRDRILRFAENPAKLAQLPTKRRPSSGSVIVEKFEVPADAFNARLITIDDIDSFAAVRTVVSSSKSRDDVSETTFKNGVKAIIGEDAEFKDWGGETSDLMTTRLTVDGKRKAAAFAFKGPGLKGKLVPAKMGKNGDQCQRLFQEPADVFVIQHWREIDSSVLALVEMHAKMKSYTTGREVLFCLIDGQDTDRLIKAYLQHFATAPTTI